MNRVQKLVKILKMQIDNKMKTHSYTHTQRNNLQKIK